MRPQSALKASLDALPTEILIKIINHIEHDHHWLWDRASLRIMNKRFYDLIPAPSFRDIFIMEQFVFGIEDVVDLEARPFLACGYCLRLRPRDKFAAGMTTYPDGKRFCHTSTDWQHWARNVGLTRGDRLRGSAPGKRARCRFCVDCGPRPMNVEGNGTHRYRGDTWEEGGLPYTRCFRCGQCAQAWEANRSMCVECHSQLDAQYAMPVTSMGKT